MDELYRALLKGYEILKSVLEAVAVLGAALTVLKRNWRGVIVPFLPAWAFLVLWASDWYWPVKPPRPGLTYLGSIVIAVLVGFYARRIGVHAVRAHADKLQAQYEGGDFITAACSYVQGDTSEATWSVVAYAQMQDNAPLSHNVKRVSLSLKFLDKVLTTLPEDDTTPAAFPRTTTCLRAEPVRFKGKIDNQWLRDQYKGGEVIWARATLVVAFDDGSTRAVDILGRQVVELTTAAVSS